MQNDFLKQTASLLFAFFTVFCVTGFVFAQEAGQQPAVSDDNETAPPPIFSLSNEEKSQLSNESDIKRRTQLCLTLADARLRQAEEATAREDYQTALTDLGSYQAIIDNQLKFLQRNNNDSGKVRDNFRRMDISLRSYGPRIETIRRTTPFEFAVHLMKILNFTRDARARALDSFFSDSVVADTNADASANKGNMGQPEPAISANGFKEKKP